MFFFDKIHVNPVILWVCIKMKKVLNIFIAWDLNDYCEEYSVDCIPEEYLADFSRPAY